VTIDKSLRRKGRLARSRNVMKRDERIDQLKIEERWTPGRSPLGLPKVRVPKTGAGKKKKKKAKEEADTTTAAAEATPAATGKGAASAAKTAGASKAAAPAKPASGKK
jgi:small basic protein (TIGR04137 family)